ncbi:hypothetical protein GCM10027342_32070 [Photobacterium alginatilyticum]
MKLLVLFYTSSAYHISDKQGGNSEWDIASEFVFSTGSKSSIGIIAQKGEANTSPFRCIESSTGKWATNYIYPSRV